MLDRYAAARLVGVRSLLRLVAKKLSDVVDAVVNGIVEARIDDHISSFSSSSSKNIFCRL